MSDQSSSPPKPKPGSLRDRIAAFENKGASPSPASGGGPPPPRPKPSGLSWKPRPPSPSTSPDHVQSGERKPQSTGAMSASDAMESIGRGGSLKERMAALQGKGAFGGPPPPIAPKPNVEKPKWKPSPAAPEGEPNQVTDMTGRAASRSPPPRAAVSPSPENQTTSNLEGDVSGGGGDPNPEEEERQRRAAIAARMARLGGARIGMGPPIFAPKPAVRRPEPASEVEAEVQPDQLSVVKESSQATSPPQDLPAAAPEADAETDRKDEPESTSSVPPHPPTSMPVPVGPRRAAPPRKKSSKNAPTTALPEPPVEEASAQSPPISDEPLAGADHDASAIRTDPREISQAASVAEVTHDDDAKRRQSTFTATIPFHEEPERQEAEEEHVAGAASHVEEESSHTVPNEEEVLSEQPPGAEAEEDEEAHRRRVAAKLAQMGAINPLAGPPPAPPRQSSSDELAHAPPGAPLDVEDEVNIGETVPPPPASPESDSIQSIKHDAAEPRVEDDVKADEDHRDGNRVSLLESEPIAQGTAPTHDPNVFDASDIAPVGPGVQQASDSVTTADQAGSYEIPAPRIPRSVPPPPPVNLLSKPTSPSSPPVSPPARTSLHATRVEEVECPPSPDIPPRPVPPPGRSGSMSEDVPSPRPRWSIPPRRMTSPPTSPPPPVPTSSRPVSRRPDAPQIITTLDVQERTAPEGYPKEHVAEEEPLETVTPKPDVPEDEDSSRRRAIAERMARLGGIRFSGPPPMNPLSRPPLPAAPPPTSIPPDESEEEVPREGDEEDEAARKQRIAAKLVGMGGMRLGMFPPPAGLPPSSARRLVTKQEDSESEDVALPVPVPPPPQRPPPSRKLPPPIEASVEREPEQTGPGSRGTSDDGVQMEAEESEMEEVRYSDAEVLAGSEEEGVSRRRLVQTPGEALPTPPPRMASRSPPPGRPPIPTIPTTLLGRRSSGKTSSVSGSRQASLDEPSLNETPTMSGSALRPQSEYVMVEAEDPDEDAVPASARRKSTRSGPQRAIPALPPVPPSSAIDPSETLSGSAQWELAPIPQGAEFGEGSEMASSGWSEDSTAVHVPAPVLSWSPPASRSASAKVASSVSVSGSGAASVSVSGSGSGSGSGRRSLDQPQLTTDELMAIWGKTGVRVVDVATTLYEKSKRALVGDGSHAGFVRAVLAQVPGVVYPGGPVPASTTGTSTSLSTTLSTPSTDEDEWGYVVYAQTGDAVRRRVSEIMPGDVIAIWDAKFRGHKGLHAYTQTVGPIESPGGGGAAPVVGIVSEFDHKKSKVRAWQANQHVGQQTVENVSYRLDDLKSGQVKVYRVLEA